MSVSLDNYVQRDLNVANILTVNKVIELVKAYTGAGAHILATDGKRVNTISHTSAVAVTLPTTPPQGTIFTIVNINTGKVTITSGGGDSINTSGNTEFKLNNQNQRVVLQYVGTIWYSV